MAKSKDKTSYRLFANSVCDENVEFAKSKRFNRITTEYLLIYTSETVKGWPEITDNNINILTDKDRQWLFDCNMELIAEELAKRSEKFGIDMDIAVAELEKALSQEKESLSGQQEK